MAKLLRHGVVYSHCKQCHYGKMRILFAFTAINLRILQSNGTSLTISVSNGHLIVKPIKAFTFFVRIFFLFYFWHVFFVLFLRCVENKFPKWIERMIIMEIEIISISSSPAFVICIDIYPSVECAFVTNVRFVMYETRFFRSHRNPAFQRQYVYWKRLCVVAHSSDEKYIQQYSSQKGSFLKSLTRNHQTKPDLLLKMIE